MIIKQNKFTVFILILIIVPIISYFNLTHANDLINLLNFLVVPGIILGVLLLIVLNTQVIQKRVREYEGGNLQKNLLFLEQDENEIFSQRGFVFRLAFGFIPVLYFFSKITITDRRIIFSVFPFMTIPSLSFFFQKTKTSFSDTHHIKSIVNNKHSLKITSSNNESLWIFIKDKKILSETELLFRKNTG